MGTAPYTPGGLSNSKLKMANATPEDVLSGKKFYSGDKTLKTGNLRTIKIGSGSSSKNFSVSGQSKYRNFTNDNFHVAITGVNINTINRYKDWSWHMGHSGSISISKSYNPSNGNLWVGLNLTNPSVTWTDGANVHTDAWQTTVNYDVYLVP